MTRDGVVAAARSLAEIDADLARIGERIAALEHERVELIIGTPFACGDPRCPVCRARRAASDRAYLGQINALIEAGNGCWRALHEVKP